MSAEQLDLNAIRAKLSGTSGPQYWRSLEAVAETPEFKEFLHREFPANASEWNDPVGRRGFLKLMSASLALAGVTACTVQPDELIVPYVRQPEEIVPGKPLFFATAASLGGVATGLLVESHEGRPTKIEGNPDHPASLGGTDLFAQASILSLYDPDRSSAITELGQVASVERLRRRHARRAVGAGDLRRRRSPHPHRDGELAGAGRADSADSRRAPAGEVDSVGTDHARQRARRRPRRLRRIRRTGLRLHEGRRHPLARRRLPRRRERLRREVRARLRLAPPSRHGARAHEPSLRRRSDAVDHRRTRRSSPADEGQPGRSVRARHRRQARPERRHRRRAGRHRRLRRRHCRRSRRTPRHLARRRRRSAARRGACARARAERPARQRRPDGQLHGDARSWCRRNSTPPCGSWSSTWTPAACRRSSSSARPTRSSPRRPTGSSPRRCRRWRGARTRVSSTTRPPSCASGTCPRPTTSRCGATRARSTAPCRSCSRSSSRCTAASRRTKWWPRSAIAPSAAATTSCANTGPPSRRRCHAPRRRAAPARRAGAAAPRPATPHGCRRPPPRRSCAATPASSFEKQWRKWLHDGYIGGTATAAKTVALAAGWNANPPSAGADLRRRSAVQARRLGLRRPLRQQRLAAGTAQAGHQAHLGQRRAGRRRARPRSSACRTATC